MHLKLLLIIVLALSSILYSQEKSNTDTLSHENVTDTIDVTSSLYKKNKSVNTSYTNVVFDELRKTPGALEDVIKYFTSSSGVSVGSDVNNLFIVRGGSPVENLTVIDGIEIQNPNHFGVPGSTGGLLSFINLKLIKDVDFFTGGFPVKFGDKISSVMDIKFKDSIGTKHLRDINLSATGFGGYFEGPITSNSSYMFSIRRSYLELLKSQLNTDLLPEYWDVNLKLNYRLNNNSKISLLGIFATDKAIPYKENDFVGDTAKVKIIASGITYQNTGKNYELKFSVGYNWNLYKVNYRNFILDINDNEIFFRQEFNYRPFKTTNLTLFTGLKNYSSKYIVYSSGGLNSSNHYSPGEFINTDLRTYKVSGGINLNQTLFNYRLQFNLGLRIDNFPMIKNNLVVSPRAGVTYKVSEKTSLNASAGIYYQAPEMLWVLVDESNRNLNYIKAEEFVLGAEHYIKNDIKLSAEAYLKQYSHYPVSVYNPYYIYINSGVDVLEPNFLDAAIDDGNGYYSGIDVSIQKKNSGYGIYGFASYSLSRSGFAALRGGVQTAEFDYRNQLVFIIGLKIKGDWSFSSRFKYAGGRPYTPFNVTLSKQTGYGIYDLTKFNQFYLPEYIREDVRIEKRFSSTAMDLVIYLEVQNVFNRENIYNYYWSWKNKVQVPNLQLFILPILGVSWQF